LPLAFSPKGEKEWKKVFGKKKENGFRDFGKCKKQIGFDFAQPPML